MLLFVLSFSLLGCGKKEAIPLTPEQQILVEAIEARQANFQDMGTALKTMKDEIGRDKPDTTTLFYAAKTLQSYTRNQANWFPEGSGPSFVKSLSGHEIETDAKSDIWEKPEEFQSAIDSFSKAVIQLLEATQSENAELIASEFRATGKTCKGCHDQFREPDE